MQLVDSHCHIDFEPLAAELPAVLSRAAANQVDYMLCVAVNLEDFPRIVRMASAHPHIFASVGVHPNATDCADPGAAELVELADHPEVVAIGETGLDYFRSGGGAGATPAAPGSAAATDGLDWQRQRFANHIAAAKTAALPLIIHTRAAAADTMRMLEDLDAAEAGGVMHCFAEDWATAQRALALGFYISFSGIVTFKNAAALKQVAQQVPLNRMLVETDSPYLAPTPFRGQVNEPAHVRRTAEYIAELRGQPVERIAEATTENFFTLFAAARRAPAVDGGGDAAAR